MIVFAARLDDGAKRMLKKIHETADIENAKWLEQPKKELFDGMGALRKDVMQKVRTAHQSTRRVEEGVNRHMSGDGMVASIDIVSKRRATNPKVPYSPGTSRKRYVGKRTEQLRSYTGSDAQFILRFLNQGTGTRIANSYGPSGRGSKATYGNRGQLLGGDYLGQELSFFRTLADKYVKRIVEQAIKHIEI